LGLIILHGSRNNVCYLDYIKHAAAAADDDDNDNGDACAGVSIV